MTREEGKEICYMRERVEALEKKLIGKPRSIRIFILAILGIIVRIVLVKDSETKQLLRDVIDGIKALLQH